MALNFNNFETVLQTKLDTITDEKDMLLLGKAIEATVGNVTVSEIQAEAAIQTNAVTAEGGTQISAVQAQGTSERSQINAMSSGFATTSSLSPVATSGSAADLSNLRTVGGQSIAGVGGDIATLPAGGSAGQVLKKDASNNPAWGSDAEGKVLQIKRVDATGVTTGSRDTSGDSNYQQNFGNTHCSINFTPISSTSIIVVNASAPFGIHGNGLAVAGIWNGASNCLAVGLANGYGGDGSGMSLTGSFVSGSTATRNISFRVVGSWGGHVAALGAYRHSPSYNMANTWGNIMVMEVEQ